MPTRGKCKAIADGHMEGATCADEGRLGIECHGGLQFDHDDSRHKVPATRDYAPWRRRTEEEYCAEIAKRCNAHRTRRTAEYLSATQLSDDDVV